MEGGASEVLERARQTRAWVERARGDLTVASRANEPPAVLNIAVFLCQQAVEKALKAFLTWREQPFRRTHALDELLLQCVALDADFTALEAPARTLSPYAVEPRYPSEHDPTREEAAEALRLAGEVVRFVEARVSPALAGPPTAGGAV